MKKLIHRPRKNINVCLSFWDSNGGAQKHIINRLTFCIAFSPTMFHHVLIMFAIPLHCFEEDYAIQELFFNQNYALYSNCCWITVKVISKVFYIIIYVWFQLFASSYFSIRLHLIFLLLICLYELHALCII